MQDQNQLQTALNTAIASEDYALASRLRDRLKGLLGDAGSSKGLPGDWQSLGILDWLAERAERLGYRFPTGDDPAPPPPSKFDLRAYCTEGRASVYASRDS